MKKQTWINLCLWKHKTILSLWKNWTWTLTFLQFVVWSLFKFRVDIISVIYSVERIFYKYIHLKWLRYCMKETKILSPYGLFYAHWHQRSWFGHLYCSTCWFRRLSPALSCPLLHRRCKPQSFFLICVQNCTLVKDTGIHIISIFQNHCSLNKKLNKTLWILII